MQKIGLEAVLEMAGFKAGEKAFTGALDGMIDKSEKAGGVIGKLGSVIGGLAKAGVGLAVTGIGALTGVIAASIGPAAEAQAIEAQLDQVLKSTGKAATEQAAAWEAAQGKTVTSTKLSADALGELSQKLTDTQLDYNTLGSEIQEQKQKIWEMTNVWGEQGLNVQTAKDKLAEMTNEQDKLGSSMDTLRGKIEAGGQTITTSLAKKLGLTAPVVQMTKDELLNLANALSQVTPYEDDLIVSTEAVLLQFQNIGKEVFPQATEMALDLAQRLGIDAVSAAKLLGKALVTPGEGLLRLKQAGVTFSDSQTAMIEKMVAAGNMAGAQKLIMDELALSVGGAARAAGNTFSGQMEIMKNKIGNVQESIGTAFLPMLTRLVSKFGDFVTKNGPAITGFFSQLATWLGFYLPVAVSALSEFWTNTLLPAIQAVGAWIQESLIPALANIYNWLAVNLPPAISALASFWSSTLYPALVAVGEFIVNTVVPALVQVWNWLATNLPPAIAALSQFWTTTLLPAIQAVGMWIESSLIPTLTTIYNWLAINIPPAIAALAQFWTTTLYPALVTVGNFITTSVIPALTDIWNWIGEQLPGVIQELSDYWTNDLQPAIGVVWGFITTKLVPAFKDIWSWIKTFVVPEIEKMVKKWKDAQEGMKAVGDYINDTLIPWFEKLPTKISAAVEAMKKIGTDIVAGIKQGISDAWDDFVSWILGKMGSIIQAIADFLGIGSPAKATMFIGEEMARGIAVGFANAMAGGLTAPGISMGRSTMSFAGSGAGVTNNSIGGDTIVLNVNSREAWAGAQSWIESRRRERINVGM